MSRVLGWTRDLALGVRLTVGGGRDAYARLAITMVGVGLGVAVLLLAAALPAAHSAQDLRAQARVALTEPPTGRSSPVAVQQPLQLYFRGDFVRGHIIVATVDDAPTPPGVDRLPAAGEMVVSPALAALLASPDGDLLRPRLPWTQVGVMGRAGLTEPGELVVLAGGPLDRDTDTQPIYGWGSTGPPDPLPLEIVLLAMVGAVVALIPVVVLIAAATRVAAAARERRLAALRLIGADAGQTRRLASGEALVGAIGGLLVGLVLFLVGREFVAQVSLLRITVFGSDLMPSPVPFVLVMVAVPVVAVAAGVFSLRHVVAQPLGATRQVTPPRRRLWWRLVPLVVGLGLLISQSGSFRGDPSDLQTFLVLTGLGLTALAVPVLLPWLVQRAVNPLSGGSPSWQLAIRRIQLDSGTPARAAGGLAAVLTAAVAFQTMMATAFADNVDWQRQKVGHLEGRVVEVHNVEDPAALDRVAGIDGVLLVRGIRELSAGTQGDTAHVSVWVASCEVIRSYVRVDDCGRAEALRLPAEGRAQVAAGDEVRFHAEDPPAPWTVPSGMRDVEPVPDQGPHLPAGIILVPEGSVTGPDFAGVAWSAEVLVDQDTPDVAEHVANALVPEGRDVISYSFENNNESLVQLRNAMLVGALIVLLLAASSLLIVSVEQIRERRRQLAALAAAGVGRRTLAASVLWQATVPFAVATVASLAVGTGLGALLMRVFGMPPTIDWLGMLQLATAAAVAVLVVTALTLPALRRAIRPEGLRME
jgi:hypothetical protein